MADRYDDSYWNTKYAEAHCHEHPDSELWYDQETGEWICPDDDDDDSFNEGQETMWESIDG